MRPGLSKYIDQQFAEAAHLTKMNHRPSDDYVSDRLAVPVCTILSLCILYVLGVWLG